MSSQLVGRYPIERAWANDLWHLAGGPLCNALTRCRLPAQPSGGQPTFAAPEPALLNPHVGLARCMISLAGRSNSLTVGKEVLMGLGQREQRGY